MDLKQKLQSGASPLSFEGATPEIKTGATKQSQLHLLYSTIGNPGLPPIGQYASFSPGLPTPSLIDINATDTSAGPSGPLFDYTNNTPMGTSFSNGTYENSGPSDGNY